MKTIERGFVCAALIFGILCLAVPAGASANDFYPSYLQAKVVGHLPLTGGVRQMFLQQEDRRQYLYVQQANQRGFTVIDTTQPDRPKVVNHVPQATLTMVGSGLALSETPDSAAAAAARSVPELVRVLDVSDPAHPRVAQTFDGVTSIVQDGARNMIYIANGDGVWIVSHRRVLRRHECSSSDAMSPLPNCN